LFSAVFSKGGQVASKIIYERFFWFHNEIKNGKFPNTKTLAEKFETTRKTAQRDIEFMRDRMHAPLVYISAKIGYSYRDNT
jgi:predicted DNA-binding transcriptional regulator YafY